MKCKKCGNIMLFDSYYKEDNKCGRKRYICLNCGYEDEVKETYSRWGY